LEASNYFLQSAIDWNSNPTSLQWLVPWVGPIMKNDPEGLGAYALPLPAKSRALFSTVKVTTLREVGDNKFHGGRLKMNKWVG